MKKLLRSFLVLSMSCELACQGRPRAYSASPSDTAPAKSTSSSSVAPPGAIAELDLSGGAPESASVGLLGGSTRQTYYRLTTLLRELPQSSESRGVLVRFGSANLGWARSQELAGLLSRVREAQKTVVCHADGYSNATTWIAARGCDRIWVSPAGGVETVGIALELLYAHRLLADKLGISVDFLQIGKYKGAEEPLTRDGPSPEARASLEGVLGAIREQWLSGLSEARGQALREAAEDGPFSPDEAKARGLVDAVGYLDEAREEAKSRTGASGFDVRFGGRAHGSERADFTELVRTFVGVGTGRGGPPHVTLVRALGAISMEGGGGLLGQGSGITEKGLGRTVRALTEDASVKAVILRIDSPGGSALASDLLWRALMQLRARKPLIVSIGDMAASGGYYLASTANRILAEPTSIVGSIGVVGGKLALAPALETIGIHVEPISAPGSRPGTRALNESPFLPWDDDTRERVRAEMTAVYELFLRRVAEGRGVSTEVVAASAEGRIFAGEEAKSRHLVDEWGGLERALALAKELAHLDANAPVQIAGESSGVLAWFDDDGSDGDSESRTWLGVMSQALGRPAASTQPSQITALLGSFMPLAGGETILAALPFALHLH